MEGKTKIIVLVETDYLEVDYSGGAVSQNNFVPETYAYSYGIEELNKLRANEMINGLGWQNNFPFMSDNRRGYGERDM